MKKLQLTFNKKYLCSTRIGLGALSEVYQGYQLTSEKELAIKLDPVFDKESTLQREAKFYRVVKGGTGIPHLYWYGVEHNFRALVTENLGPSLDQLLRYCKGVFSLKTVLLIADQVLDRIQWIHSKGLVYNDIDPSNFLVGLGQKQDKIFLTDLGSCQKYLDDKGTHFPYERQTAEFRWNQRFRSINSHIKKKTGRRDDLESIGYMLVYFFKNRLPWDEVSAESENADLATKECKTSVPANLLCEGLSEQFVKYFNYVHTLEFEQEPDYVWLRRMFKDLFDRSGFVNNRVLDWAERHKY